ncbi:retrotransposon protein [Cucumis melo var. makuwa]|nr:retrotransposon protein [Cucumis melo var. makuwa]
MVVMFLNVLAHDVKDCVIQREFVRSGEIVSQHFNLILLVVLRLHDELIKKPMLNYLRMLERTYIKVNVPAADRPTFRTLSGKLRLMYSTGQQYHLQEWRGDGNVPTIAKEYFNMKSLVVARQLLRFFTLA